MAVAQWLAVAAVLYLSLMSLSLRSAVHPVRPSGVFAGWIAVVMSAATAWFLLDRGWRSSLVWIAGPLAAFNYLAVAAPADGITVLLSIGAIPVIGLLAWKFGVEPRVLLVLALCLLFGLASTALGMMLSIPYAGICSRSARWVCNLTGALLGGITAGLFCLSFWYASKRLTRPQERSA